MQIIPRIAATVEALLGTWAEEINQEYPVIQRVRKFTPATLARTLILGFLAKPNASDKELAEMATLCGVEVTPQAIEQRFTERLAQFAEQLLRRAMRTVVEADTVLAPLLARFTSVLVLDSTTISLPDALRDRFAGCGGSHGGGQAALKLQVQWDLSSGAFQAFSIEPGRNCDYKTPLQSAPLPAGSLRIADLGYFDTATLQRHSQNSVFWLSRLQFGTTVFQAEGAALMLLDWLDQQPGSMVDEWVRIGTKRKVSCRLLAWRVPQEVANRRRQKLIAATRRKDGRTPSQERLAWCNWTILVTNVPVEMLTPQEALVLYRARWQIELLFKRWKSLGRVAELSGATPIRQMAQLWLRLLAAVVEQWLVLTGPWGNARLSLTKASQLIRRYAILLAHAVGQSGQLLAFLQILSVAIHKTARNNKRKRPHTFDLLHNPTQLEMVLT